MAVHSIDIYLICRDLKEAFLVVKHKKDHKQNHKSSNFIQVMSSLVPWLLETAQALEASFHVIEYAYIASIAFFS